MTKETCKACEHYEEKKVLSKTNKVIKKSYCSRFGQELSVLNPCKEFKEPESLIMKLFVLPFIVFVTGIISFIFLIIDKGWILSTQIFGGVALFGLVSGFIMIWLDCCHEN